MVISTMVITIGAPVTNYYSYSGTRQLCAHKTRRQVPTSYVHALLSKIHTVDHVLRMNGGIGETSYTQNSSLQREVIEITKPVIKQAMINLCTTPSSNPTHLSIADLGCSSGPNTFLVVSELMRTALETCKMNHNYQVPEFQIFLNDLPMNDFNTVFRSVQRFQEDSGPCFVAGVPGSFYGRLFPAKSIHFFHSSYCISWLSQAPKGVGERNGRNIYPAKSSLPCVTKAYYEQFCCDFASFLKCRAEELVSGGRMVLTMVARENDDPLSLKSGGYVWGLLALALNDLVAEGLIEQEKLYSFNIPFYTPSAIELEAEILKEGSFEIEEIKVFKNKWSIAKNQNPMESVGHNWANSMRAASESLLESHFGQAPMDDLFQRYGNILDARIAQENPGFFNITISLTR